MKNMRRRMMVLLLALALMLLGATAGAEDKKYTVDLVSGTSATLPGGIDAQFLNHVTHRVMDVDGGLNVFIDLNDDGEDDVLMFMPSDQNDPWPCSRLAGADLLTQDYSVTYAPQDTSDNITVEFKVYAVAHVHTYGAPTWEWATDNRTAQAVFNCTNGDDTQRIDASVVDNYYAPTCTADGYTIYIAKASFNGMSYTDEKTVTDAGTACHSYGAPTWKWAGDYSGATATFKCTQGDDSQTVNATVADKTTAATCTADGKTVYTATAKFGGKDYTDMKDVAIPATGHSYGEPEWSWKDDNSAATATFKCARGDDSQTVDATVADKTTAATCTADGKTVYTATATFNGKDYTDMKDVAIPATGHSYGAPEWSWKDDNSAATATFKCARGDDSQTVDATVKSDKAEPTCTADGKTVYTATAKFGGKDYTDEKTVTDAGTATGHSYGAPTWKWADDYSAATATFKCAQGDDSQTLNAAITGEAVPDGGTKYTAAVVFGDKSYTDSAYAAPKYTLTVNYVNEGGARVAEPYVSQLAEGEAYAVPSPALPRLVPDRAEVKGTMGAADIAETVTYSDDDVIITFVYNYNNKRDTTTQVAWRGEATTLKPNPFTKPKNWRFMGWNTQPGGGDTAYADGAEITPAGDMTLYGQWSKEFKLSFHRNSGSSSRNKPALMLVAGETVDLPKCAYTPKAGYEFAGWNTDKKGMGKAYADGAKFTMPGKNTTLYAQWKGEKATITFNYNGGKGKMKKITTHYGAKITLPKCAFTHGDNAFDCWTTNKDGSGKAYRDEAEITVDQISMKLYAQWKGLEAKVTFKHGSGKGNMAPITVTTPATLVLPDCAFTKKGHAFTGWMDGTKAVHAPGDKIRVTHDITLTAQWAKQGCIVFNKGNRNAQGEMADQYGLPGEKVRLAKNAFTLAGYEFTGWNTNKNGDGLDYGDGATVVIKDTKTLTLFAQWRKAEQGKLELTVYKTISKSKDLKLEAKVTLDGEPVKDAQVTFRFLGKTRTAKTNSKGVAKVTFSKSLMKNLEVGSKVQYSATYGDTTIKIKAKIV